MINECGQGKKKSQESYKKIRRGKNGRKKKERQVSIGGIKGRT